MRKICPFSKVTVPCPYLSPGRKSPVTSRSLQPLTISILNCYMMISSLIKQLQSVTASKARKRQRRKKERGGVVTEARTHSFISWTFRTSGENLGESCCQLQTLCKNWAYFWNNHGFLEGKEEVLDQLWWKQKWTILKKYNVKVILTPTWFEHAAFWSGVRRATVAPRSQDVWGPTEIWTRIAGFKVQSANHYTIGPYFLNVCHQRQQQKEDWQMTKNMFVSSRVRTGDLVRVRHTW